MPTRNNGGHPKSTNKNAVTVQGTSGNARVCAVMIAQTFQSQSLQHLRRNERFGGHGTSKTPLFFSGLLLLFMAFLVGCPAPFGYFPNPEDRLPPNAIDSNLIITAEPFWYWRELGSTGDWAVIASADFTSPVNVELIARSSTPGAKLFYLTGRKTAPPMSPNYPNLKSGVIDEGKPLQHRGSSYKETYTAIAIASLQYPSIFKWVDVTLDVSKAGTPTFNIPPKTDYRSPQTLELLTPSKIPGSEEPLPLYYTFSTTDSEPPDPTDISTVYTAPINILMFPNDIYRIKVISIHPDYDTSDIEYATFARRGDEDSDGIIDGFDVDNDNDGLIDIYNINMLEDMINDPDGYSFGGSTTGGPTVATGYCPDDPDGDGVYLCGYELRQDLDFTQGSSYASGTVDAGFCPDVANNCIGAAGQTGFPGIGSSISGGTAFSGIFEGHGHTISNFYRRANGAVGLFNNVEGGSLRNIGVVNAHVFGDTSGDDRVGALVGLLASAGEVLNSYSTGSVDGGGNDDNSAPYNYIGGLIGDASNSSFVRNSHSRATVDGNNGVHNRVGGLIGRMGKGVRVVASYATGNVTTGTNSSFYRVGGLVGEMTVPVSEPNNFIIASYATGNVTASTRSLHRAGGLVGQMSIRGNIIASYATGPITGTPRDTDHVGGLVGYRATGESSITASYSTSNLDGGAGDADKVGRIAGGIVGTTSHVYGFGTKAGGEEDGDDGTAHPSGVSAATGLTLANAGAVWNQAASNTAGAWDFGSSSQNPAPVYADYDGTGTTYSCADFPATLIGGAPLICGTTLVGGAAEHGR